jgi:hypothetical protein
MNRQLLICASCKTAIFVDSDANKAPRWTGKIGDPPNERMKIDGQDDLRVFKTNHLSHEMIEVALTPD